MRLVGMRFQMLFHCGDSNGSQILTLVMSSVQSSLEELTECPVKVVRCCSWGERSCRLLARIGIACPGAGKPVIPPSAACGRWRSLRTYMEWR